MPFCTHDRSAGLYDSTPIENMFLTEYLPSAPDDYLRVYLYLRMLCLHPEMGDSVEEVGRALHLDTDTIQNAMTYWERQGLVERLTDRPPTYAMRPVLAGMTSRPDPGIYEYRDFNASLQAVFGSENLLHPKQYAMANDWLTVFGLSGDAVLKLAEARLKRSRSRKPDLNRFFQKLDETVREWADRGIRTAEEAEAALETDGRVERAAAMVMKQLSMRRSATRDEMKLVDRWLNEWGFSEEDILSACSQTTKARQPTVAYLSSVLENRRSRGGDGLFEQVKDIFRELGENAAPTPDQLNRCAQLLEKGFEPGTLRFAAVQCARKGKHHFTDLEWMLEHWAGDGLFREADARAWVESMNRSQAQVKRLLEKAGTDRQPSLGDITMFDSWQGVYPAALIDYAAECAFNKQLPVRYMDKLLSAWRAGGITTVEAARAEHRTRSTAAAAGNTAAAGNAALDYTQREHTLEDYADIYVDLSRINEEGGGKA